MMPLFFKGSTETASEDGAFTHLLNDANNAFTQKYESMNIEILN